MCVCVSAVVWLKSAKHNGSVFFFFPRLSEKISATLLSANLSLATLSIPARKASICISDLLNKVVRIFVTCIVYNKNEAFKLYPVRRIANYCFLGHGRLRFNYSVAIV